MSYFNNPIKIDKRRKYMTNRDVVLKHFKEGDTFTTYQLWLKIIKEEKPQFYFIGRPRRLEYVKYKPGSISSTITKLVKEGTLQIVLDKKGPEGGNVYERRRIKI